MTFTEKDKLKALAIVHVFETGKPFGDYAACAVLNDGAGVSYGINQFTHRSGSLAAVVRTYLALGGTLEREMLTTALRSLADKSAGSVAKLSRDDKFKRALRAVAATGEMRLAQRRVAYERYLQPAVETCERMGFVTPLALAVVYDSITHGSWEWISARVKAAVPTVYRDPLIFEKSWITEYVRTRHRWLTEVRRLRVTNYRTKFFLNQIAIANWTLALPVTVHGARLTNAHLEEPLAGAVVVEPIFATPSESPAADSTQRAREFDAKIDGNMGGIVPTDEISTVTSPVTEIPSEAEFSMTARAGELASTAASGFDHVDGAFNAVVRRTDAAKSMWATIAGSASQAAWAVIGFVIGLPRVVWIVVACIAAALTLVYLYRQITLGRIRETRSADH